jgi:hypothetical protein
MQCSYDSSVVFQTWRYSGRFLKLAREHGRLEVKHIRHPVVLIDAGHHVGQLGELITALNQQHFEMVCKNASADMHKYFMSTRTVEAGRGM